MAEVYINGKYYGDVENPKEFVENLRNERRLGHIPRDISIYYDKELDEVRIETGPGRVLRPLIVVKDGKPLLTEKHIEQLKRGEISWEDLVNQGIIEYIDASEEENAYVAFYPEQVTEEHTHLEISPIGMLGIVASLVPFGQHNQGVRMIQGAKNQKQGIGFYAANFPIRVDNDINLLHYPQVPLVTTVTHDIINFEKHPSGQNLIVAVMAYEGYNIEDAIIVNKASIDRGMGRSTYYKSTPFIAEELRYPGGLMDRIGIPDKDVKGYKSEHDYRLLEDDGIIFVEAEVKEGDVIVGKTSPPRFLNALEEFTFGETARRDSSVTLKHGESGIIDNVFLTESDLGNRKVVITVRDHRIPEIGDKFTSRHGQKGVIGMVFKQEDMPFTESGIVPDIIFSPHGVPSRMTVSHLLELLAGKAAALSGRFIDATTFESEKEEDIKEILKSFGFREDGSEVMYDPITGKQMVVTIFVGSMYYLRLKHLAKNKLHARASGPVQLLTRQPTEGKVREGGLRLGEMEKDTFVAHGASLLLKERFSSDQTKVPVCNVCGMFGYYDHRKDKLVCPVCKEKGELSYIEVSYASKLFLEELKSMFILPRIKVASKLEDE